MPLSKSSEYQISTTTLADKLKQPSQKLSTAGKRNQKPLTDKQINSQLKNLKKNLTNPPKKSASSSKKATANEEEANERESLIWKIRKYLTSKRFGQYLSKELGISYTHKQLQKLKIGTLRNIISRIRIAVNNMNTDKILDSVVYSTSLAVEKVASPFYDVDGLTENLQTSDPFLNALESWKIEQELPTLPPATQLLLVGGQIAVFTHEMNKRKVKNPQPQKTMEPPDEKELQKILEGDKEKEEPVRKDISIGDVV